MKELEILLDNFWIIKDDDKELFYQIKDGIPEYKNFLAEKLGYHIIQNSQLIKLEKIPGKAEAWMGIQEFESPMEYAFLCLLLMFLEDKGKEEQFVLSSITEFIEANYPGEKIDWTLFRHRKSLVKVLRFATKMGMLKVDDGDDSKFTSEASTEVLYENTGLSKYFTRSFTMNILNYTSYRDFEKEDELDIDKDKGIIRRQRAYRKLLMSPVVYKEGDFDPDFDYIKKQRSAIDNDFEKYLGLELHVHKNCAMVVLPQNKTYKSMFPNGTTINDIILQMNYMINNMVKQGKLKPDNNDIIIISKTFFEIMIKELRDLNSAGWSKEYREMDFKKLYDEIIHFMEMINMIEVSEKEVKILPLCGKVIGRYPDDFYSKEVEREVALDEAK
ncbi:MAG: TIGR02678 family protein [Caloramator sp.]|nr:TIGR02678 family protein [Caloramator sp.]